MLKRVKELLGEVDARTAAKHITLLDCKVTCSQHKLTLRREQQERTQTLDSLSSCAGRQNIRRHFRNAKDDGSVLRAGVVDVTSRTSAEA